MSLSDRKRTAGASAAVVALAISVLATSCAGGDAISGETVPADRAPSVASKASRWKTARNTALVVMDMQEAYMPVAASSTVVPAIERLVRAADEAGATVVWVYTESDDHAPGTPAFELAKPFVRAESHLAVVKAASSAFMGTDLEAMLDERGVGRVVICGLASSGCVNATVEAATGLGYYVVVAEDAHTVPASTGGGEAIIESMNAKWAASGYADVLPSSRIRFGEDPRAGLGPDAWEVSPEFAAFLDSSFRKVMARSPEWATQAGVSAWAGTDDAALDPLDPAGLAESDAIERAELAALDSFDMKSMTAGDRLAAAAYRRALADSIALRAILDYDMPANPTVFGVAYQLRSLFVDIQPVLDLASAKVYVARLGRVAARVDQAVAQLERAEAKGVIAPRVVLQASLGAIREVSRSSARRNPLYEALADKLDSAGIGGTERETLLSEAAKIVEVSVIPSYKRFEDKVLSLIPKASDAIGLSRLPGGAEAYATLLRARTTTDLTPDQIHELGLKELERIHAEISSTAKKAGWGELSARDAVNRAFGSGYLDADAALAWYRERLSALDSMLPAHFPLYPSSPVAVEVAPMGGYYQPGPVDGSRPGTFYVASGQGARMAGMATLLHHETIPGHHLQIAIMQELRMPMVRRLVSFTAYVEGWALYAERLMAELGAYADDPAGDIGRLQAEAWRAARLVVDTGIHARGWSFDKAADFLAERGLLDHDTARSETVRYASIPAQATAYYAGFLVFLSSREKARKALGPDFELGAFHQTALACGSLPLDELEKVVDRWIDAVAASRE